MRKLMIVAVLAAIGLGGAACADNSPSPGVSATLASAADETREVCAQALAEGAAAAIEFNTQIDLMLQAGLSGDEAKATEIEVQLRQRLGDWQTKLTEWSGRNVQPEVKTALSDAATTVKQLNDPNDTTPVNDVKAKFAEVATKLTAACA